MEDMERLLYLGGSHKVLHSLTDIISEKKKKYIYIAGYFLYDCINKTLFEGKHFCVEK